jgi:hypothetical protein
MPANHLALIICQRNVNMTSILSLENVPVNETISNRREYLLISFSSLFSPSDREALASRIVTSWREPTAVTMKAEPQR